MWHIHNTEYYAPIKKNEFMSFAGTWMKLEAIILSKLTQEQKTKFTRKIETIPSKSGQRIRTDTFQKKDIYAANKHILKSSFINTGH